jgi:hypothetical protein
MNPAERCGIIILSVQYRIKKTASEMTSATGIYTIQAQRPSETVTQGRLNDAALLFPNNSE